eukprot:Hpha_TRINITY_DN12185_c0_g1::TRINITY_DN12185_c0_g1_i1::g.82160::m.82160
MLGAVVCVVALVLGQNQCVVDISAGTRGTCFTFSDGSFKCFGYNIDGRLGYGDTDMRGKQAAEMGSNLPLFFQVDATSVRSGGNFACALTKANRFPICWGKNTQGQLGRGDTVQRGDTVPSLATLQEITVPCDVVSLFCYNAFSCVLCGNKDLRCWGYNIKGQCGVGTTTSVGISPGWEGSWSAVNFGSAPHKVRTMLLGSSALHTCAIFENGGLKCWGQNTQGQLGYGDVADRGGTDATLGDKLPFVDIGINKVAAGCVGTDEKGITCVVYDNGKAGCWGDNAFGQLGMDDVTERRVPPSAYINLDVALLSESVGKIACSGKHVCAVSVSGDNMACWGNNADGQLGNEDKPNNVGGAPGSMGMLSPLLRKDRLGGKVLAVSLGYQHTCVVIENKGLKCWGSNMQGQLGTGTNVGSTGGASADIARLEPVQVGCPTIPTVSPLTPSLPPTVGPSGSPLNPTVPPSRSPLLPTVSPLNPTGPPSGSPLGPTVPPSGSPLGPTVPPSGSPLG